MKINFGGVYLGEVITSTMLSMRFLPFLVVEFETMTRGNQRDLARAKTQKKQAEENKGVRKDGVPFSKAKESDAEIMRQKQEKALAKKAEEAAAKGS
jgi:hypothetical protein